MRRFVFPFFLTALAAACAAPSTSSPSNAPPAGTTAPPTDVAELSAADARARMEAGTLTSHALTQAYLDRIAKLDDAGPRLESVIELNAAAIAQADALDAERKAGK